uniref:Dolichol kinase n=1 Tax=uncultured euryarchaeote Alv-FOS5 TaxID=337891 RepID=Q3SB89_9EURY|nr:dolichol kinase [uncultured euryarchaeote Alv-FOS5]
MHPETFRKFFVHGLNGLIFAFLIYVLPVKISLAFFIALLGIVIYFAKQITRGKRYPILTWLVAKAERRGRPVAKGAVWYFYGVVFILTIFGLIGVPRPILASALLVVALGDSVSTGLGRIFGKRKLPRTKTKTWVGTSLGVLFAFVGIFLVLNLTYPVKWAFWLAFVGSVLGMTTEAYLRGPDDNFTIPVMSCAGMVITLSILTLINL